MDIDKIHYRRLLAYARRLVGGNRFVSWMEPEDYVQEFLASRQFDSHKQEGLIFRDLRNFIRDIQRHESGKKQLKSIRFSEFDSKTDNTSESLEVLLRKHSSALREKTEPGRYLGEGGYRDSYTGMINRDLMLRDMLVVMLRYDRNFCLEEWEIDTVEFEQRVDCFHNLDNKHKGLIGAFFISMMVGETQAEIVERLNERLKKQGIKTNQSYISRLRKDVFTSFLKKLEKKLRKPA